MYFNNNMGHLLQLRHFREQKYMSVLKKSANEWGI